MATLEEQLLNAVDQCHRQAVMIDVLERLNDARKEGMRLGGEIIERKGAVIAQNETLITLLKRMIDIQAETIGHLRERTELDKAYIVRLEQLIKRESDEESGGQQLIAQPESIKERLRKRKTVVYYGPSKKCKSG